MGEGRGWRQGDQVGGCCSGLDESWRWQIRGKGDGWDWTILRAYCNHFTEEKDLRSKTQDSLFQSILSPCTTPTCRQTVSHLPQWRWKNMKWGCPPSPCPDLANTLNSAAKNLTNLTLWGPRLATTSYLLLQLFPGCQLWVQPLLELLQTLPEELVLHLSTVEVNLPFICYLTKSGVGEPGGEARWMRVVLSHFLSSLHTISQYGAPEAWPWTSG